MNQKCIDNSGPRDASGPRPMNVEAIAERAGDFEYNARIPLRQWLRAADTLQKEAHFYERDSNDQQTYLLLLRHALLVLEFLPNHPEAGNSEFQQRLSGANKIVRSNLAKLELLKPRINNRYDEYEKLLPRLPVGSTSSNQGKWISEHLEDQNRDGWHNDPALDGSKKSLQASQDAEMAVKIHRSEVHRKDAAKRFDVQYDYTSKKEKSQHISVGAWQGPKRNLANKRENDLDSLSMLMQQVRLPKDSQATRQNLTQFKENPDNKLSSLGSIIYPKVPLKARRGSPPSSQPQILAEQVDMLQRSRLPYVPPKISASVDPPPVPEKISDVGSSMKNTSTAASATRSRQNSLDTRDYTFVPSAYLENGTPLRTIFVPPDLRHHFLKVAQSNTRQNLETCGFLCGTLVSNALFVSRLVIPEQESTSDTCEMTNESAFFDYCDAEELIVLGWIHTHPTQTCFMSSRDLHTHAAYQAMMAESVAVVCAPSREPSWGVFRLTDPPGMRTVLNCQQTGIFHPHAEVDIYTDALKPGHVLELPGLEYELADLRGA